MRVPESRFAAGGRLAERLALAGLLTVLGGTAALVAGAPQKASTEKGVAEKSTQAKSAAKKRAATGARNAGDSSAKNTQVRFYRRWTVANKEPAFVPNPVAALCAPAAPSRTPPNPHAGKYIRVYVNSTGRQALLHQKTPRFPTGSIIVKEKLAAPDSRAPELLTVMRKRAAGFDPQNGDWEYLVMNGAGTRVQEHGKLSNCQGCHIPQKEEGYVFRTYLPDAVQRALR